MGSLGQRVSGERLDFACESSYDAMYLNPCLSHASEPTLGQKSGMGFSGKTTWKKSFTGPSPRIRHILGHTLILQCPKGGARPWNLAAWELQPLVEISVEETRDFHHILESCI